MNKFLRQNKIFTQFSERTFTITPLVVETRCSRQPGERHWMKLPIRPWGWESQIGRTAAWKCWAPAENAGVGGQQCISRWASEEA